VSSPQDLLGALVAVAQWAAIVPLFLLLVVPHEGGHFAFAKLFGVRVWEYSVGMGPRLWSAMRSGTLYAVRALPIGGYVRLGGMEPDDYEDPNGFHAKPAYQRLLILLAGPAVNFVMAAVLFTATQMLQLNDDPGKVVQVAVPSPAYAQGIRPGDSIRAVQGRQVHATEDIRAAEDASPGQPLQFLVRREDGSTFTVVITPAYDKSTGRYLIGIKSPPLLSLHQALVSGVTFPYTATVAMGQGIWALFSGQVPGGLVGQYGVSGVIGIAYITHAEATQGLVNYLGVAALLSMALGLFNLLPLPVLDGGRIVVVLLEKARGRPFDREREMAVQRAGLIAIFALMFVIALFDLQRIFSGQFQFPGT